MDAFPDNFNKESCLELYVIEQEQRQEDLKRKSRQDIYDGIMSAIRNPRTEFNNYRAILNNHPARFSYTFHINMCADSSSIICLELLEKFGPIMIDIGGIYGQNCRGSAIVIMNTDSFKQQQIKYTNLFKSPMYVHKVTIYYK